MRESVITSVIARETLADPMCTAVDVTVTVAGGKTGVATYAPGVIFGPYYGQDLFDGGARYGGKGMAKAAAYINDVIAPALIGLDAQMQSQVDDAILAASNGHAAINVTSPVSFAALKAGAASIGMQLHQYIGGVFAHTIPVPGFLCANGSSRYHNNPEAAGRPYYAFVAYDFATHEEADYALWEVESAWEKIAPKEFGVRIHHTSSRAIPKGRVANDGELMEILASAITVAGFEGKVGLHADFAATAYYDAAKGVYSGIFDGTPRDTDAMIALMTELPKKYPLVILQDPLAAHEAEGFAAITRGTDITVAASDLFGTDLLRLEECAANKCCTTAVLRVHKYPVFSACARAAAICARHDIGLMPADTAGEDLDIVQYAAGFRAGSVGMSGLSSHGNVMGLVEGEIGPRASFSGRYGLTGSRFTL
ncbi:MAG: Enolase [Desulfovibrio sp.]